MPCAAAARAGRCPTAAGSAACRSRRSRGPPRRRARAARCGARRRRAARPRRPVAAASPSSTTRSMCAPVQTCRFVAAQHRPQERLGRVPADAGALVDVEVADAFVVAAVEVVAARDAGLARRRRRRRRGSSQRRRCFSTRHSPPGRPPVGSNPGAAWKASAPLWKSSCLRKYGRHSSQLQPGLAPMPVAAAPAVVVARLAAHVDHAVDAARAAEHLAARVAQAAPVQARGRARSRRASRCAGCRCSRGSRPGCGSRGSRRCRRPRSAARACRGRRSGGWRAGSRRCRRRRRCSRRRPSPRSLRRLASTGNSLTQPVGHHLDRERGEDQAHQPRHHVDAGAAEQPARCGRRGRTRSRWPAPMTTP